ncbi:hypothetical protein [Hydrogenophaga sp.]|uniref:hypothetical protein n=1 Tax=Hydrogenophaga sp. TaxID=1904254 RepID=UPI003566C39A
MSMISPVPSSIGGIKSLARKIKHATGASHTEALDNAAQAAHFQNYAHAQRTLAAHVGAASQLTGARSNLYPLYLTFYWKDKETGKRGRETLTIQLAVPWTSLITAQQLSHNRALNDLQPMALDHLEGKYNSGGQMEAREHACAAARAFQFMDATRLRPSASFSRVYPQGKSRNCVPHSDHPSVWFEPATRRYLFVDEPYEMAIGEREERERERWAIGHLQVIVKPAWKGMYSPQPQGGSQIYFVSHAFSGVPVRPLAAAVEAIPPCTADRWTGESAAATSRFSSPLEGQPIPKPEATPRARMQHDDPATPAITFHREAGLLLNKLINLCRRRSGIKTHLESVRDVLRELLTTSSAEEEVSDAELLAIYDVSKTSAQPILRPDWQQRRTLEEDMRKLRGLLLQEFAFKAYGGALARHLGAAERSLDTWYRAS